MPLPNVMYRICLNLILIQSAYTADIPVPNVSAKKRQNIGSKNSAKASFPLSKTQFQVPIQKSSDNKISRLIESKCHFQT